MKPGDISREIYLRSMRAQALETKAATEYPDKRRQLLEEVEELRTDAAELQKEAVKEKKAAAKELTEAALAYAKARETWLKLHLGFNAHDPGLSIFQGNRVGAGHVRTALVAVLDIPEPEARKREAAPHQLEHEEKTRNEKAGKGYRTNAQVREGYDPLRDLGAGGEIVPGFAIGGPQSGGN
ncbi:MAG: hypothetical protein H0W90_08070 [Actinobacteria bacterium]|nr:hypothetical protein [Actinomycetota bacterium]